MSPHEIGRSAGWIFQRWKAFQRRIEASPKRQKKMALGREKISLSSPPGKSNQTSGKMGGGQAGWGGQHCRATQATDGGDHVTGHEAALLRVAARLWSLKERQSPQGAWPAMSCVYVSHQNQTVVDWYSTFKINLRIKRKLELRSQNGMFMSLT